MATLSSCYRKNIYFLIPIISITLLLSCKDEPLIVTQSSAYPDLITARQYQPSFADRTGESGLPTDIQPARISAIDYDNDGNIDLAVSGIRVFKGNGTGGFTETTNTLFPAGAPAATGSVWADIDNDGDLDVFCFVRADGINMDWTLNASVAKDTLWRNDGGSFADISSALPDLMLLVGKAGTPTSGAGWADYDNDGFVDLATANNWTTIYQIAGDSTSPTVEVGNVDFLFHNNGGTAFIDSTDKLLIWFNGNYPANAGSANPAMDTQLSDQTNPIRRAYGLNWGDYDNDGDQDLYVSNYRLQQNHLYENNNGDFKDVANIKKAGGTIQQVNSGTYGHTIGSAWGDYDLDGYLDLAVLNLSHPNIPGYIQFQDFSNQMQLLHNNQANSFQDVKDDMGMQWRIGHATPCWGDINNDSLLDAYFGTIFYDGIGDPRDYSDLYLNKFDTFTAVGAAEGYNKRNDWTGLLVDVNHDGLLDIIAGGYGTDANGDPISLALLINTTQSPSDIFPNTWLSVKLIGNGTTSNRSAIGARITIDLANSKKIIREVSAGIGGGNQIPFVQHFGLGAITPDVNISVRWPDGSEQAFPNLAVNSHYEFQQN